DSNVGTVTIDVYNHKPTADDVSYSILHNQILTIPPLMGLVHDADNDPLTVRILSGPTHGTLSPDPDGSFLYSPQHNWAGDDSIKFVANDGVVDSDPGTITIHVTNNSPIAINHFYSVEAGTTLTVPASGVLEGATDPDNDSPLTAILGSNVSNG